LIGRATALTAIVAGGSGTGSQVDDSIVDEDVSEHLLPRMPSTNSSPTRDADYGTRHWLLNQLSAFMSQEKQPAQL